ncbi:MAG: hypothetical protein GWO21_02400, partial [Gammaproteobacteria bacterium]|nr:hypothetical protein [Gammaproteobacteria bacterium]
MGLVSHIKQMLEDRLQEGGPAGLGYRVAWATAARELGRPVSKEELEAAIAGLVRDNVLAGRQV